MMLRLFVIFFSFTCLSCSFAHNNHTKSSDFDFDSYVGWFHGNCIAIKNPSLSKGTKISMILFSEKQKTIYGHISRTAISEDECFPLLSDRKKVNINNGYYFYTIKSDNSGDIGIGVINDHINIDKFAFKHCNTSEGISFNMQNKQEKSNALWQGYYYLGYDIEPTCSTPTQ